MTGKALFLSSLLIVAASLVFSEDVIMEVKPNPVRKGYQFLVTLYIDHDNTSEVTVVQPKIPEEFKLVRGPAVRSYYVTMDSGKTRKKTRVQYTFLSRKAGRFVLGRYRINAAGKEYSTEPVLIGVGIYKDKRFFIPYEVSWRNVDTSCYVGQAVPLTGQVANLPEILIFEKVEVPSPSSGIFTRIDDPGPITKEPAGNEVLYTVPVAGYIYTPSREGVVKIPGIKIRAEGITSYSGTLTLKVKGIPSGIRSTGAIGNFTRRFNLEEESSGISGGTRLHVVIEGIGNLNYLEIPPPEGDGMTISEAKDEQDYHGTINGFEGRREKVFTLLFSEPGEKEIRIPPFPFLDPVTGNVTALKSERVSVTVLDSDSKAESDPFASFLPEDTAASHLPVKSGRYKDPESYLWLLPGPLVFIIFYLKRRKKFLLISLILLTLTSTSLGAGTENKGSRLFREGNYGKALDLYLSELGEFPDSPSLFYNAALCYNRLGMIDKAVYAANTALMYNPFKDEYRSFVHAVEMTSGIEYSLQLGKSVYPDIFLFLMTIAVNGAAFAGVIYLVRKRNFFLILAVLLSVISIITSGGLVRSSCQWKQHYGIINHQFEGVKKIPDENSDSGFEVKEGEMVKVIGSSGDYEFIENGIGLKGWLKKDSLLILGGDIDPLKVLTKAK